MKLLHSQLRSKTRMLQLLRQNIKKNYQREAIVIDKTTSDELAGMLTAHATSVKEKYGAESFPGVFWEQQLSAASKKNARSIRWHPLIIKWCLYLHHKSSGAYNMLRDSGILKLPSGRTLRDYRHFARAKTGFSYDYDKQLIELAQKTKPTWLSQYLILLIDEMYVKEGLVFNKSSGALIGFIELGDIDDHLRKYESVIQESGDEQKPKELAKTMVVIMVRGALTNVVFPYAVFAGKSLKGHNLFPLFWEAIERLTRHQFRVLAATCDGASCNRKLFQMHNPKEKLVYKTINVYSPDRHPIYFISDPPHLIKTLRNCLANVKRHLWVSILFVVCE